MDKNVLRSLSYGVYVISALEGERSVGCVANSAMQVSSKPATIAISINHDNYTNGCIAKGGKFVLALLAEDSNRDIIGTFGFKSSRDTDKFDLVDWVDAGGIKTPRDCIGYVVCSVVDTMESSTHTVFLGEVEDGVMLREGTPMTYAYYHNVIKGKSPKNAPTYVEEEQPKTGGRKFVCTVCGYVYEGDELPPDFKCPVCGQGADKFKEI